MTGVERLRELAREQEERSWSAVTKVRARLMREIADQIEREHAEDAEDAETAAWVRGHGGLDALKRRVDAALYYESVAKVLLSRLGALNAADEPVAAREAMDRLEGRATPEGYAWPRDEHGVKVLVGSHFVDELERVHIVTSIRFLKGEVALHWNPEEPEECMWLRPGERVRRPVRMAFDADGEEVRERCDVWWICEGDERGVHAERLRVEAVRTDGLVECSPYNGGTGVSLDSSELYVNRPVLAADGWPLCEGETAYLVVTGTPVKVRTIFSDDVVDCVKPDTGEDAGHPAARDLTHERPDSWERLEEDATRNPFDYCKDAGIDVPDPRDGIFISDVIEPFAKDLVRRAKALAERDA